LKKNKVRFARNKFLHFFRKGFYTQKYIDWERGYKWNAHLEWEKVLNEKAFKKLLASKKYQQIALNAVRIESRTNLLFSFEKMALRDAVKIGNGAELFAKSLYNYIYGKGNLQKRFEEHVLITSALPRKQTRVMTWPLLTVFGFIADPGEHIFLKPLVTKKAASVYGFDLKYYSKPNWETYQSLLDFADIIKKDLKEMKPRDMIDIQSFIWVLGSSEYDI
jgi:hypothetical protein